MSDHKFVIPLTTEEQGLLWSGLEQWGGPANLSDAVAVAMGFDSRSGFFREAGRLKAAIEAGEPLTASDWKRALQATEIVFVSDLLGAGQDWETCTGIEDADTIALLRSVQRKMIHGLASQGRA